MTIPFELTEETIMKIKDVEKRSRDIKWELTRYYKPNYLECFHIRTWDSDRIESLLKRHREDYGSVTRTTILKWSEITVDHGSILQLLDAIHAGLFTNGVERLIEALSEPVGPVVPSSTAIYNSITKLRNHSDNDPMPQPLYPTPIDPIVHQPHDYGTDKKGGFPYE